MICVTYWNVVGMTVMQNMNTEFKDPFKVKMEDKLEKLILCVSSFSELYDATSKKKKNMHGKKLASRWG